MNENPEGTPNPLNPNPAPVGPQAAPETIPAAQPAARPAAQPVAPRPVAQQPTVAKMPTFGPAAQATRPAAPAAPTVAPAGQPAPAMQPAAPQMTAPAGQPMPAAQPGANTQSEANAATEPEKKKGKGGLIAILIIFFLALIGSGVAALVVFDPFGWFGNTTNRFSAAVTKTFETDRPTNVALNGTVSLYFNDEDSAIAGVDVNLKTAINIANDVNTTSADIVVTMADESELEFKAQEVKVEDGDMFVKVDGLKAALNLSAPETNCVDGEEGTNCATEGEESASLMLGMFASILDQIDGTWLKISGDNIVSATDMIGASSVTSCVSALGDGSYLTASGIMNVMSASTENLTISKKANDLYRLDLNMDKLNQTEACANMSKPTVYVEIDENNNFTRLYVKAQEESVGMVADLAVSYPNSVTVTEPGDYTDLDTILMNLIPSTEVENVVTE